MRLLRDALSGACCPEVSPNQAAFQHRQRWPRRAVSWRSAAMLTVDAGRVWHVGEVTPGRIKALFPEPDADR